MSKYEEIREYLKEIALLPESRRKMPTVRDLMRKFGASQSPVMRAVRELENTGILACRPGIGIVSTGGVHKPAQVKVRKTGTKGTILYISVDYFSETLWNMLHSLNIYCAQSDLNLHEIKVFANTNLEEVFKQSLSDGKYRGIILQMAANPVPEQVLSTLGGLKIPVVLTNSWVTYDSLPSNVVFQAPDCLQMARMSADFLKKTGHRRVAYIRNEPLVYEGTLDPVRDEFISRIESNGMKGYSFSSAIKSWENSMEAATRITQNNLEMIRKEKITALLYSSIQGAFAGKTPLQEAGLRIPEDISILGNGDCLEAQYAFPGITTFTIDYPRMACDAVDMILGKLPWSPSVLYPYHIVERDSVLNRKTHKGKK